MEKEWLESYLDGGVRRVQEVRRAAHEAGVSTQGLKRARKDLGAWPLLEHGGMGGAWFLCSPDLSLREARDLIGKEIGVPWIPEDAAAVADTPRYTGVLMSDVKRTNR